MPGYSDFVADMMREIEQKKQPLGRALRRVLRRHHAALLAENREQGRREARRLLTRSDLDDDIPF